MKGPRGRWQFDLRRVWQCPRCGKREFTTGQIVNRACPCGAAYETPTWMCLVEEDRRVVTQKPQEIAPQETAPPETAPPEAVP